MILKIKVSLISWRIFLLVVSAFLIGFLNGREYMHLFGFGKFSRILPAVLLAILCAIFLVLPKFASLCYRRRETLQFIYPIFIIVLIKHFLWFMTSSGRYATDFTPGDSYFVELLFFLIIFISMIVFVCAIQNIQELLTVNFFLVMGCAIAPVIAFIFFPYFIGTRITAEEGIPMSGGFWNFAVIGVVTTFWFSYSLMKYYSKKQAMLLWGCLSVIMLGAFVGLSRTIIISLGSSLLVYFLLSRNFSRKVFFLLLLAIAFIIFAHCFDFVLSNLQSRLYAHEAGFYDDLRVQIWKEYLSHISEYWLSGASSDGHRLFCQGRLGPHSIFLNWFVRFGIAGLLAFLWLLYGVILSIKKIKNYLSKEEYARIMAWFVSYITLVAYNESGFLTPSLYAIIAFIFVLAEVCRNNDYTYIKTSKRY